MKLRCSSTSRNLQKDPSASRGTVTQPTFITELQPWETAVVVATNDHHSFQSIHSVSSCLFFSRFSRTVSIFGCCTIRREELRIGRKLKESASGSTVVEEGK